MNQAQLERAVCRATGESRDVIRRLGFQEIRVPQVVFLPRRQVTNLIRRQQLVGAGK